MNEQLSDEFLDVLSSIFNKLTIRTLFYTDKKRPARERHKTFEFLVESLCAYEKRSPHQYAVSELTNVELFLKLVLEKNAPLFVYEEEVFAGLGIIRDRSRLSRAQENRIAVRSAAQILWRLEGIKISKLGTMVGILLDKKRPFFKLLALDRFSNERTIENWVRPMFPRPPGARKRSKSIDENLFSNLAPIPGVFSEGKMNFQKLRFAAICLTRILKSLGMPIDEILQSPFIRLLSEPLGHGLRRYVSDWAMEAFSDSGSIFPSKMPPNQRRDKYSSLKV